MCTARNESIPTRLAAGTTHQHRAIGKNKGISVSFYIWILSTFMHHLSETSRVQMAARNSSSHCLGLHNVFSFCSLLQDLGALQPMRVKPFLIQRHNAPMQSSQEKGKQCQSALWVTYNFQGWPHSAATRWLQWPGIYRTKVRPLGALS